MEYRKERSEFRVRLIDPSGTRSAPVTVAAVDNGRGTGFPRITRWGDEVVFSWSASAGPAGDGSERLQVHTAVAALP